MDVCILTMYLPHIQVNLHATSQVGNIQKSCKKARRQQREEIAGRSEKDLEVSSLLLSLSL